MSEQMVDMNEASAYIANADGTYTAVPFTTTEDGQVVLALNEMGLGGEGEDMVVIAADDNLDMATLENLIASGAVTTVSAENGTEYLQVGFLLLIKFSLLTQVWRVLRLLSYQQIKCNY